MLNGLVCSTVHTSTTLKLIVWSIQRSLSKHRIPRRYAPWTRQKLKCSADRTSIALKLMCEHFCEAFSRTLAPCSDAPFLAPFYCLTACGTIHSAIIRHGIRYLLSCAWVDRVLKGSYIDVFWLMYNAAIVYADMVGIDGAARLVWE